MTDRESHRAAVEAGYASLAEYIEKWGDDKMDIVERLRNCEEASRLALFKFNFAILLEAADEIERLREALQFYAEEENWHIPYLQGSRIVVDGGNKARSALQQKETE